MPRGSAKYPLPISPGGVREDEGLLLKDGEFLSSRNWLVRGQDGMPRPGYSILATLDSNDRVIGVGFRGSRDDPGTLYVHTLTKGYVYNGATFSDVTGTWSASQPTNPVRFTSYTNAGGTTIYRVNLVNAVDKSTGGAFANIASAPTGIDITICSSRGMVARAGGNRQRVQWSNFNDLDTWGAADFAELSETGGDMVACRAFGPLRAGVYMDDAVYLAIARAAKQPFQFDLVSECPGPASPSALLEREGVHYWLGKDGVVRTFDGSRVRPFNDHGDHLAKTLRDTFEWSERLQAWGFVLQAPQPELWFFYPVTSTSDINYAISVNLATGAMNPHIFGHSLSAGAAWVNQSTLTIDGLDAFSATIDGLDAIFPTIDSMGGASFASAVVAGLDGKVYRFGNASVDDGLPIPWEFVHGWKTPAGQENILHLDCLVSYWKKLADSLVVTAGITLSDSLSEDEPTDPEWTATFDLLTGTNHQMNFEGLTTPQRRGKFVRVRHAAASSRPGIAHRAAAILGWPRNMR